MNLKLNYPIEFYFSHFDHKENILGFSITSVYHSAIYLLKSINMLHVKIEEKFKDEFVDMVSEYYKTISLNKEKVNPSLKEILI